MRPSYYLPACCHVQPDGVGRYEVGHFETSPSCRHVPSGGTGGYADGKTRCNRIIGQGATRAEAIDGAREYLGLPTQTERWRRRVARFDARPSYHLPATATPAG